MENEIIEGNCGGNCAKCQFDVADRLVCASNIILQKVFAMSETQQEIIMRLEALESSESEELINKPKYVGEKIEEDAV